MPFANIKSAWTRGVVYGAVIAAFAALFVIVVDQRAQAQNGLHDQARSKPVPSAGAEFNGAPEKIYEIARVQTQKQQTTKPQIQRPGAVECLGSDCDRDGRKAVRHGGDDCDDNDANRFPGNVEICNRRDEDCDAKTFGRRDKDKDGLVSDKCCNPRASGRGFNCGRDPDDNNPAIHWGSQICLSSKRVRVVGLGDFNCDGACVTQPSGTGVCIPD